MAQLIRMAGHEFSLDAIERTLGQGQISKERLADLQHALEREGDHNAFHAGMRGERAWCQKHYDLIDEGKISDADMLRGGWLADASFRTRVYAFFAGLATRDRADQLRVMHELVKASRMPEEVRLAAIDAVAQNAPDPLFAGTAGQFQAAQARLRCAATALAAERYRLEYGRWPPDADVLVKAGLLKKALKDPFDGQPLRRKTTPTGIVIHSLVPVNLRFELWRPEMRGK